MKKPNACLLNGGASLRMGKPKALIEYDGEAISTLISSILKSFCDKFFILGTSPLPNSLQQETILQDKVGFKGPLAGLITYAEQIGTHTFLWATDMPLLSIKDVQTLFSYSNNLESTTIPYNPTNNLYEILFGFYTSSFLKKLIALTKEQQIKSLQQAVQILAPPKHIELHAKLSPRLKSWNYPIDIINKKKYN